MAANDGTFGQVYDKFWSDAEILEEWTPEDRLVWLYLLTCPQRSILGIFELSLKNAAMQIGFSTDALQIIINRLEKKGKVKYNPSTREIAVKKWLQYRGSRVWTNENLVKGVLNAIASVKDKSLLAEIEGLEKIYKVDEIQTNSSTGQDLELESNSSTTQVQDERQHSLHSLHSLHLVHSDTLYSESDKSPPKPKSTRFSKPTLEEVTQYCHERSSTVSPTKWFSYYEANGWKVGRSAMKDWRASIRYWEQTTSKEGKPRVHGQSTQLDMEEA